MKTKRDLLECARILTKHDEKLKPNYRPKIPNQNIHEITLNEMISDEVGWEHFKEVFMVSGLSGNGVGDIQVIITSLSA